jgi:hypothetical protein
MELWREEIEIMFDGLHEDCAVNGEFLGVPARDPNGKENASVVVLLHGLKLAAAAAEASGIQFRVWWIPQVPGKPFHVDVPDWNAAQLMMYTLGRYDAFQFDNNIKPDYASTGGIEYRHPALENHEWLPLEESEHLNAAAFYKSTREEIGTAKKAKVS